MKNKNLVSDSDMRSLRKAANGDASLLRRMVTRRQFGELLPYVLGKVRFCGREFGVDRRVYIPNVETERLAMLVVREVSSKAKILEVGSGCGAIAITIAKERPRCTVYGSDLDRNTLPVARHNALRHGAKVRFSESYYVEDLDISAPDIIVADLPYGDFNCQLPSIVKADFEQFSPVATFHPEGRLASYAELIRAVRSRKWKTTLYLETGRISKEEVSRSIPSACVWEYIQVRGYSITKVWV